MIVDTESDLNIYVESAKEAKAKKANACGCCSKPVKEFASSDGKTAGCCSKAAEDGTNCGDGLGDATTPERKQVDFCSAAKTGQHDTEITAFNLPDIDFNACAGEYLSPSCIPRHAYSSKDRSESSQ